jgi:hypothetical protein
MEILSHGYVIKNPLEDDRVYYQCVILNAVLIAAQCEPRMISLLMRSIFTCSLSNGAALSSPWPRYSLSLPSWYQLPSSTSFSLVTTPKSSTDIWYVRQLAIRSSPCPTQDQCYLIRHWINYCIGHESGYNHREHDDTFDARLERTGSLYDYGANNMNNKNNNDNNKSDLMDDKYANGPERWGGRNYSNSDHVWSRVCTIINEWHRLCVSNKHSNNENESTDIKTKQLFSSLMQLQMNEDDWHIAQCAAHRESIIWTLEECQRARRWGIPLTIRQAMSISNNGVASVHKGKMDDPNQVTLPSSHGSKRERHWEIAPKWTSSWKYKPLPWSPMSFADELLLSLLSTGMHFFHPATHHPVDQLLQSFIHCLNIGSGMIWSAILPPNVHQPSLIARYLMSSSPNLPNGASSLSASSPPSVLGGGSSMSIEERCQLITRVYNDSNKASVGIAIARRGLAGHDIRSLFIRDRRRNQYFVCTAGHPSYFFSTLRSRVD